MVRGFLRALEVALISGVIVFYSIVFFPRWANAQAIPPMVCWLPATGPAVSYDLHESVSGGVWTAVGSVASTDTQDYNGQLHHCMGVTLTPGAQSYVYRVWAVSSDGRVGGPSPTSFPSIPGSDDPVGIIEIERPFLVIPVP